MANERRKELLLEGLSCADCSRRIAHGVSRLPGVKQADVNFTDRTLALEIDGEADIEAVLSASRRVITDIEPQIVINEKAVDRSGRRVWIVLGLCCAECALKIEQSITLIPGVTQARVDFVRGELQIDVEQDRELARIRKEAHRRARGVVKKVRVVSAELKAALGRRVKLIAFFAGIPFFAVALTGLFPAAGLYLYIAAYALFGADVLRNAARNIVRGRVFDENFLMTIATAGAFAVGAYPEAAAVMLFYKIGSLLEEAAVERSRRSIRAALALRPERARRVTGSVDTVVLPEAVAVGDLVRILPGERVPLDSRVTEGSSWVDGSLVTGESEPALKQPGDQLFAGTVNQNGVLVARVEKTVADSAVAKIIDFVEKANRKKSKTEHFIGAFTRWYTPFVVLGAALLAVLPPLFTGGGWEAWIYRSLIFLVISCPCALVLSVPLTFAAGIGSLARSGILVKGGRFLEVLRRVGIVIFDKTGTLTENRLQVLEVGTAGEFTREELLRRAALAESYSAHPAAQAIRREAEAAGLSVSGAEKAAVTMYDELAGRGVRAVVNGGQVLAGTRDFLAAERVAGIEQTVRGGETGTVVYVASGGRYAGFIRLGERIKSNAAEAVRELKSLGVSKTVMLSGDTEAHARAVGATLGIDEVHAPLLPEDKVNRFDAVKAAAAPGRTVLGVGDGVNDAPLLSRADVGAAMGGLGRDAAIEAADVVILDDDLSKLPLAVRLARKTHRLVIENILLAFGVKALVLALGAFGVATMWEAVFADVGVALLALANALRIMRPLKKTVQGGKRFSR